MFLGFQAVSPISQLFVSICMTFMNHFLTYDIKQGPADPRSVRCRKIGDVTISLLSAVSIACSRTTTIKHADAYLQHMQSYLEGLKELFPEYKFCPNHHMSLHLYEYIKFYGPVHSWWTFPFERVIGILQRISTNYKPGKHVESPQWIELNCSSLQVNMKRLLPVLRSWE